MSLEQAGIPCYIRNPGESRKPAQTHRPIIKLFDALFNYIRFNRPEFQRIHEWFANQTIVETKGVFKDVHCTVNGFTYHFGLGGIHGSVESQTVVSDVDWIVEDWDVVSYYPKLAIINNCYPEHLSEKFCEIYEDIYNQRAQFKKGTPENVMMKFALNGSFGDTNSKYSPFYDPLYTMTITINGQLLLCMLSEQLIEAIPELSMIQINTDGLTIRYPRHIFGNVMTYVFDKHPCVFDML